MSKSPVRSDCALGSVQRTASAYYAERVSQYIRSRQGDAPYGDVAIEVKNSSSGARHWPKRSGSLNRAGAFGALVLFLVVVIIALSCGVSVVALEGETASQPSEQVSPPAPQGSSQLPRCVGGDITRLTGRYEGCLRYLDKFERYAQETGLSETGMDMLFVFVVAKTESGCRSRYANDSGANSGGIMQATSKCRQDPAQNQCHSIDDEIKYGLEILGNYFNGMLRRGVSGRDAALLGLFAYNRGPAPANLAIQKMQEQNMPMEQAVASACEEVFSLTGRPRFCYDWVARDYHCDGDDWDSICDGGKPCVYWSACWIRNPGEIHYATERWAEYVRQCGNIGGQLVDEGAPLGAVPGAAPTTELTVEGEGLPTEEGYRPTHPYFTVPYSVNPSFSVTIPYDFSIYDTIPGNLNRLERCRDDIDCIVNNVSLIEQENQGFNWVVSYGGNVLSKDASGAFEYPAWEAYCEVPGQHAVNSIAEAIDTCAGSQGTDCVCSYALPVIPEDSVVDWGNVAIGVGISVGLSVVPVVGPLLGIASAAALSISDASGWDERIISFVRSGNGVRISMRPPGTVSSQFVPLARFKQVDSALRGDSAQELRYARGDTDAFLDLYKDRYGNITIYAQGSAPSSEVCEVNNKMVKFCVVQDRSFLAYNLQENRMGIQQLVLKFAYLFRSEVTDVDNFEVLDAPLASNVSLLVWDVVEGVDVDHYTVYYSENSAMEANLRGQSPAALPEEMRAELASIELYVADKQDISMTVASLTSPLCIIDRTTCSIAYRLETAIDEEVSPVMLDDNVLYYSTVEGRFFYILPDVRNDFTYFFAITATDTSGEESPSFNMPEAVNHDQSVDDVPPGLAELRDVRLEGTDVVFDIAPVGYNIDGSTLDPALVTRYRIYCFDAGAGAAIESAGEVSIEELTLAGRESVFAQGIPSPSGSGSLLSVPAGYVREACGFTDVAQEAKFVISGIKSVGGIDLAYAGEIPTTALSDRSLLLLETD